MDVVVLGAGISGMSAARRLRALGARVRVFEASERPGGLLRSERVASDSGPLVIDRGPDSILATKPAAVALAEALGLGPRIVRTRPEGRGAYVLCRGRLERIPNGFHVVAPSDLRALWRSPILSTGGKVRASTELLRAFASRNRGPAPDDQSLESFVQLRFGDELLARLAQPMAGGIYGAPPHRLGLGSTMPRFLDLASAHGSVTRGLQKSQSAGAAKSQGARYGAFVSFDGGMGVLPEAMAADLDGHIETSWAVWSLERAGTKWRVSLRHGPSGEGTRTEDADGVVIALGARTSAELLEDHDPVAAAHIQSIPRGSAAIVTLAYPRDRVHHPLDAAGVVVPSVEGRAMLASTWSSQKWPGRAPDDTALFRVFLGGHGQDDLVHADEAHLVRLAHLELARMLGIEGQPTLTRLDRYVDVMPRYEVGHARRMNTLDARIALLRGVAVAGNFHRGVGIPDSIADGARAAEQLVADLGGTGRSKE